ncbi:hypothetical protein [Streptomyces blattellae]|uniref:hypothetical protein n=1 Tax=Streptomyces blattellae TaxID=2569855 RepID=UPI0018AC9AC4|nr:hypothetical protein [Streptomyces blattellae]
MSSTPSPCSCGCSVIAAAACSDPTTAAVAVSFGSAVTAGQEKASAMIAVMPVRAAAITGAQDRRALLPCW